MDRQPLIPCAVVRCRAQRIGADQNAAVGPPERNLVPGRAITDRDTGEWAERPLRHEMVTNTEARGEGHAVTVVSVQQLEHPGGSTRRADAFLDAIAVDRVDHPDAAVLEESVRATLHELGDDPAAAAIELVAEPDSHPGERTRMP